MSLKTLAGRAVALAFVCSLAARTSAGTIKCPLDSVKVGSTCVDLYEESVWQIPPSNTSLVKAVLAGKATLAALTGGGATQLGCTGTPFNHTPYPANFPKDGNWTAVAGSSPPSPGVYAVSIPNVLPSACITWFQANQACRLSGKRLARNDDWQAAAQGTPDPGTDNGTTDCNVGSTFAPANTGSRLDCKSAWGTFDMVGNVDEWVADWADLASGCIDWTSQGGVIPGGDRSCFGGPGNTGNPGETLTIASIPGALNRGGDMFSGAIAGVFAVDARLVPYAESNLLGFRCAR
jgi:formylglycine-generating enzyme required for sulfatase activity